MAEARGTSIHVEVVYALPDVQAVVGLEMPQGSTVRQALEQSRLAERYPDIDPDAPIGVFGRRKERDAPLDDGDRVEIYRPLIADPKRARRARARRR